VMLRWKQDPSMHIYHYAAYEVSAMRRLMGQHGTREDEVDALLHAKVFVDLYQIIRQGILLGASNYSLKTVEKLYQDQREGEVKSAGASMVYYANWMQSGEPRNWEKSPILKDIRDYNEVDCVSTWQAEAWLRQLQANENVAYLPRTTRRRTHPYQNDAKPFNAVGNLRHNSFSRSRTNPQQEQNRLNDGRFRNYCRTCCNSITVRLSLYGGPCLTEPQ
jgi:hypothetical protein